MAADMALGPEHVIEAARFVQTALRPAEGNDWTANAGELEWDCRRVLDHMVSAPLVYSTHLATQATERLRPVRPADPTASAGELLDALEASAAILAAVVRGAPPDARGFHGAGMADPEGFVAMACDEMLIHGHDISQTMGVAYEPPNELCERVLRRLFPWAPKDVDPWPGLLWANGRAGLPEHERQGMDWYW